MSTLLDKASPTGGPQSPEHKQRTTHIVTYDVKQIMPAPSWHCFGAGYDEVTKEVWFFEHPVVGWGVRYGTREYTTYVGITQTDCRVEKDEESEVYLLVFDVENRFVVFADESFLVAHNTVVDVFSPASANIDSPEVKDQLRQKLQDKMGAKMETTQEAL
jgi:hypothetical protein